MDNREYNTYVGYNSIEEELLLLPEFQLDNSIIKHIENTSTKMKSNEKKNSSQNINNIQNKIMQQLQVKTEVTM